jgi:hypothetical protein
MPSILDPSAPIYNDVRTYLGDPDVPASIKRLRLNSSQAFNRVGTPVLLKKAYNIQDVENGVAQPVQSFDSVYDDTTYATDYLSYGRGFSSIDTQDGEWIEQATGQLIISPTIPADTGYVPAPIYRGYGPGFLTYAVLPDRPEDAWKLTEQGALIRMQTAMVQLPWWPQMDDNDILITVSLWPNGTIAETYERYELKQVTPITMRGMDRRGLREFQGPDAGGNRFWINQQAEMVKIPDNDIRYSVETDR